MGLGHWNSCKRIFLSAWASVARPLGKRLRASLATSSTSVEGTVQRELYEIARSAFAKPGRCPKDQKRPRSTILQPKHSNLFLIPHFDETPKLQPKSRLKGHCLLPSSCPSRWISATILEPSGLAKNSSTPLLFHRNGYNSISQRLGHSLILLKNSPSNLENVHGE